MAKQPCITDPLWIGYSNKTLSQTEIDAILNHAVTCDICADIKEGIDAMSHPATLGKRVNAVNNKVDEYLEAKQNLSVFWYWSAAAVLVLGIGFSWFILNNKKQIAYKTNDSLNLTSQKIESHNSKDESISNPTSPIQKEIPLATNDKFNNIPNKVSKEDIAVNEGDANGSSGEVMESLSKTLGTMTFDSVGYATTPVADTVYRGIFLAFENKTRMDDSYSAPPATESMDKDKKIATSEQVEIVSIDKTTSKKRKAETSSRNSASLPAPASNSNNWNNTNSYKNIINYDSSNLALAITNFNQNNFNLCLQNLETITSNPSSPYYEEGLLIKAKALIKLNKTKQAKTVLKTIISKKGNHKSEAEELLKGLK